MITRRMAIGFAGALAAIGATAGCGSADNGGDGSGDKPALHAELPKTIKDAGQITFAIQQHPPYTVLKGNKGSGPNEDLQNALAKQLGVDAKTQVVGGGLPPVLAGILSNRYDAFVGPVETTPEREKQYDLIGFISQHTVYLAKKSEVSDNDVTQVCGGTLSFVTGSVIEGYVEKLSAYCVDQGKKAVRKLPLADTNATILAVESGRAIGAGTTSASATDVIRQKDGLVAVDQPPSAGGTVNNLGMVIPKTSKLAPVMLKAFQELFDNGTYDSILKKYGLEDGKVEKPQLNPPLEIR